MRRTLLALSCALTLSLSSAAFAKMNVATTFTIIQDMAQNVAGDAATVVSITKPGAEIHDYQPTPKDLIKAQNADLILWNGLNLERWFARFFDSLHDVPAVVVSEGVKPISIYEGPYTGNPNPHGWMSVTNALIYVDNIKKAFIKYDPSNAETYTKNAASYSEKIRKMDKPLREKLDKIPDQYRYLVTSEGAFSYLAHDYKLKELYLWPINADSQGTPQQVKHVVDSVNKYQIPVVFSESTVSDKPAKQVAKETGALYGGVLYVDSLSEPTGKVPTYIDLLNVTVSTIANGFDDFIAKQAKENKK